MSSNRHLPFRAFIVLAIVCVPLYALFRGHPSPWLQPIQAFAGTFGMVTAFIVAPTLIYIGLRTKNRIDIMVGFIGMTTLLFWVPMVLLR